jgi:fatty-acyl-CoA synthase
VPVAYVALAAGATVTQEELLAWAAGHVTERAGVPKTVTLLDRLPVTDVGKLYKLALRADAARRAVTDTLAGVGDGIEVDTVIEDGSVIAVVTAAAGTDKAAVEAALDQYAIRWTLEVRP